MHFYSDQAFLFQLFVYVNIAIDSTQMRFKFPLLSTEAGHTQVLHWILAATSSSKVVLSTGWSVHENSPFFAYHSFCPRQLKFGIDVKCVCVCDGVCLCSCPLGKRWHGNGCGMQSKSITVYHFPWPSHNFLQHVSHDFLHYWVVNKVKPTVWQKWSIVHPCAKNHLQQSTKFKNIVSYSPSVDLQKKK